ncbi:Zinc finger protein 473-like protein [Frankliniella fusca]|uniref:Zinc finger protein 473-like protein n=1 Tax=Frankliniella fusca TaxID=407009 RepID=A0AAE1H933_9NEOP|nr:Zinc finger protein 473-like protein [Frankliniella fusca]
MKLDSQMATESINVENADVKMEVKTEDDEAFQNLSHSSIGSKEINVEEFDKNRIYSDMDPTCLVSSSHEEDSSPLPEIISERCAKKLERLRYPFSMLQCPQCDKTFKRASLSTLMKHVQEWHKKCSKELPYVIHEEYGLHEM